MSSVIKTSIFTSNDINRSEPDPAASVEGWNLFITGIHEEATEDEVLERCAMYGTVKKLAMNLDSRTGFLKGYAIVEYEAFEEAKRARQELNESEILGMEIKVDWAFVKESMLGKRKWMPREEWR